MFGGLRASIRGGVQAPQVRVAAELGVTAVIVHVREPKARRQRRAGLNRLGRTLVVPGGVRVARLRADPAHLPLWMFGGLRASIRGSVQAPQVREAAELGVTAVVVHVREPEAHWQAVISGEVSPPQVPGSLRGNGRRKDAE